jgi:hypothetical protein
MCGYGFSCFQICSRIGRLQGCIVDCFQSPPPKKIQQKKEQKEQKEQEEAEEEEELGLVSFFLALLRSFFTFLRSV